MATETKVRTRTVLVDGVPVCLSLVPGDLLRSDLTARDVCLDLTCGRAWDDGQSTECTPTPAGRCPFEFEHGPRFGPDDRCTVCAEHVADPHAPFCPWSDC